MREDLRRAHRWLGDPEYNLRGQSLLAASIAATFHADGKTSKDLRGDVQRVYEQYAATEPNRSKVEGLCGTMQARLPEVRKSVYIRLQAQRPPGAGGDRPDDND